MLNFASLQTLQLAKFVCVPFVASSNFVNFASARCKDDCFLRHSLLAPCLRVGKNNTHCEWVFIKINSIEIYANMTLLKNDKKATIVTNVHYLCLGKIFDNRT